MFFVKVKDIHFQYIYLYIYQIIGLAESEINYHAVS